MTTVEDIMTTKVVTIEMDDFLHQLKDVFDHVNFHHVLVVERERLRGVISDRDFFAAMSPFIDTLSERALDKAVLNRRVHQIMTRKPITLQLGASIHEAADLLLKHRISCLPVIDEEDKIHGVVAGKDVLQFYVSLDQR